MYIYVHTNTYVYIYIYTYIYLVCHGNVLMDFYGFHRRESRGPVAAGYHKKKKTTTETIKKTFRATTETIKKPTTETIKKRSCHDGNAKKNQRRKPVLKKQKKTRNHSIRSKIVNPPTTAESIQNPATETIRNVFLPRRKPFLKKRKRRKP